MQQLQTTNLFLLGGFPPNPPKNVTQLMALVRNDRKTRLDWGSEGMHQMGIWDGVTSMRV